MSEPVWVDEFHTFLTMKLVPLSAVQTDAEAVTTEGASLVPKGTALLVTVGDAKMACTNNPQGAEKRTFFVNTIAATNTCFIDSDSDGKYDQYFPWAGGTVQSINAPKIRSTVVPFSATKIDPKAAKIERELYLQYSYFASWVNILDFEICLRKDVPRSSTMSGAGFYVGCLARGPEAKRLPLPSKLLALGAEFSVEAKEGKRVQVRQLTPIPPQPMIIF